jgi:hypothetical protein
MHDVAHHMWRSSGICCSVTFVNNCIDGRNHYFRFKLMDIVTQARYSTVDAMC